MELPPQDRETPVTITLSWRELNAIWIEIEDMDYLRDQFGHAMNLIFESLYGALDDEGNE